MNGAKTAWHLSVGRVAAHVSLFALLGGELHATRADADGVTLIGSALAEGEAPEPAPPARAPEPAPAAAPIALVTPIYDPKPVGDGERDGERTLRIDWLVATNLREVRLGEYRLSRRRDVSRRHQRLRTRRPPLRARDARSAGGRAAHRRRRPARGDPRARPADCSRVDVDASPREAWLSTTDGGMEVDAVVTGANLIERSSRAPSPNGTLRTSLRVVDGALAHGSTAAVRIPATVPPGDAPPFSADVVFGVGDGGAPRLPCSRTGLLGRLRAPSQERKGASPSFASR